MALLLFEQRPSKPAGAPSPTCRRLGGSREPGSQSCRAEGTNATQWQCCQIRVAGPCCAVNGLRRPEGDA
eukprot:10614695-Alexandrium_andersonii.AAC.1